MCGGSCSCATCHIYAHGVALEVMSADEDGLLDSSDHRGHDSRLSCQIRMSDTINGLYVIIPPED